MVSGPADGHATDSSETGIPVPLRVGSDDPRGGRWTTLAGGSREWLWRRPHTGRSEVRPGAPFIDAGGLEECLPTVRGRPDQGEVWSRPWRTTGVATATIERPDFTLTRRLTDRSGPAVADYRLQADPDDAAEVPPGGEVAWRLSLTAHRSSGGRPR